MHKSVAIGSAALLSLALAACSQGQQSASSGHAGGEPAWAASAASEVNRALDKAASDLPTKDITLSDHDASGKALPEAKITPRGDLVIENQPIALTSSQREEVLA